MVKHFSTIEKTEIAAKFEDGWHPDELNEKYSKDRTAIYKMAKKPPEGKGKGSVSPHKLSNSNISLIIKKEEADLELEASKLAKDLKKTLM